MLLSRFCDNPFVGEEYSRAEIVTCTADHLPKLIAQNTGGRYNDLITATSSLFTLLEGKMTDQGVALAIQKSRTVSLNNKRAQILGALSQLEGLTHGHFERGSDTYIAIFPNGLEEFRTADLDQLNGKLETFLTDITPYKDTIGTDAVDNLATLQDQWATLRGEHLQKKAGLTSSADLSRAADAALRVQLFDSLLVIARTEKNPDRMALYFTQSLLENPQSKPADPAPAAEKPAA